jgi:hypothetical protein
MSAGRTLAVALGACSARDRDQPREHDAQVVVTLGEVFARGSRGG